VGNKCRCALVGAEAAAVLAASPAKVTFGGGPFAVFKERTTRYRVCLAGSKRATNTITRKGVAHLSFRRKGLSDCNPKRAPSPGAGMSSPPSGRGNDSRAGGLVRLVLRLFWTGTHRVAA
jgi:hypothetical protein